MRGAEVAKRCIFFLGGYEPIPPVWQHERFRRELRRFESAWSARADVSELAITPDGAVASWRIRAGGPNWSADSEYRSLLWADLVEADFGRPDRVRLPLGRRAFTGLIGSGTAGRYFAVNWRYGLFFAYPLFILTSFVVLAVLAARLAVDFGVVLPLLTAPLIAAAVFAGLIVFPGHFLMLPYMLDDWIFAGELVHRKRPGLDERMQRFATELAARLRENDEAEIVFAAHSLGCALKIDVVDRALRINDALGFRGRPLKLVSTGSSILKIALHPAAGWLREAIGRVSRHPDVFWVEYQSMVDIISFYKVNPVTAVGLPDTGRPLIRRVHVRDMLERATYRRFKGNFFRLHRQLVMGNDKRYFYDYFMVCCGPFALETRVHRPERVVMFSPDGSLIEDNGAPSSATTEKAAR